MAEAADPADRGQSGPLTAVPFYRRALAIAAGDFASHHYLTHAYENGGEIENALEQGGIYARLAPAVPHARHMHGHNLRRVGRIDEAIGEFEAADRLETEYFAREQLEPDNDWHYEHNLDLLGMSYQYIGQIQKAAPLLERAFGLPTMNLVQAVNKQAWPGFLRATNQPAAALTAARILEAYPHPVVQAIGRIEAAHVLLDSGKSAEAAAAANAAVAALKSATAGAGLASIPMQALQGEFFLRTGRRDQGRGDAPGGDRAGAPCPRPRRVGAGSVYARSHRPRGAARRRLGLRPHRRRPDDRARSLLRRLSLRAGAGGRARR